MVLHPEVLKRGQEELDRVIGKNRLPTIADQPNLPYIAAIQKECLRYVCGSCEVERIYSKDL